jgi:hypothetical protein
MKKVEKKGESLKPIEETVDAGEAPPSAEDGEF